MKLLFILACVIALFALTSASSPAFVFTDFIEGEWNVVFTKPTETLDSLSYDADVIRKVFISKDNSTNAMIGNLFFNNTQTNEIHDLQQLRITFDEHKNNTGVFHQGADTTKLVEDFAFSFEMVNNIAISVGKYQGDKTYQFIVPGNDRFVFNIFDAKHQLESTLIGRKIPVDTPKTFFQQYGMYIMMAVLMAFNMFVQNKAKQFSADQQQGQEDPSASAADIQRAQALLKAEAQKAAKTTSKKND